MKARGRAAWTVLAAIFIFACGGGGSPSGDEAGSTGGSVGSGGLSATGGEQETLSDAQVLKVLEVTHASRVAEAAIAKLRSMNQPVLDYAETLSDEHQEAGAELKDLEKRLTPADSRLSKTIAAASSVEVDNLSAAASAEFDRAYLQAQVTDHDKTMSVVDGLLGMTADSDLKAGLTALKAMAKDEHGQASALLSSQ